MKKIKQLQNDFTTPEQSKRLLELGVPADSANHYYGKDGKLHYIDGTIPYSLLLETGCTPCWSVGRLIEIIDLISSCSLTPQFCENYTESLVAELESMVCNNKFDFSKLEE